jgi:AP-3 complex subunit delta-1
MGCSLDLWGKQQVVHLFRLSASGFHNNVWCREIAEPQKLLSHLLQPNVSLLASETIGAYLQAAVKLFGSWSMELSQDWDGGRIQDVKEVVDTLISRLETFASHTDIEVQERVRLIHTVVYKSIPLIYCFRPQTHCNYLPLSVPILHRFVRKMT